LPIGCVPLSFDDKRSVTSADHGLARSARALAGFEQMLLIRKAHGGVNHVDEVHQGLGERRFFVDGINPRSPHQLGDHDPSILELLELLLNGRQRDIEVAGQGSGVDLTIVVQVEQDIACGLGSKDLIEHRVTISRLEVI
jgi:hypothetical protein